MKAKQQLKEAFARSSKNIELDNRICTKKINMNLSKQLADIMSKQTGIDKIWKERLRQIHTEGYDSDHDSQHTLGEIAEGARCYLTAALEQIYQETNHNAFLDSQTLKDEFCKDWPWEFDTFKPSEDYQRNLVKAGAMIAAELDRNMREPSGKALMQQIGVARNQFYRENGKEPKYLIVNVDTYNQLIEYHSKFSTVSVHDKKALNEEYFMGMRLIMTPSLNSSQPFDVA